jgi:hypothetical protein
MEHGWNLGMKFRDTNDFRDEIMFTRGYPKKNMDEI